MERKEVTHILKFNIEDVLHLFNIHKESLSTSYYIDCPICNSTSHKRKYLNINENKNFFNCPKCESGGDMVQLYAFFKYGINPQDIKGNKERRQEYINEINGLLGRDENLEAIKLRQKEKQNKPKIINFDPIDIKDRSFTYNHLINELKLSDFHKKKLLARGFTEDEIIKHEYRSAPTIGISQIPYKLRKEYGCELQGVAGFSKKNSKWILSKTPKGIYVPVRDIEGNIQGIQVRLDDTSNGKFVWLTSKDRDYGTSSQTPAHFVGYPEKTVYLTEGPMKADLINKFLNVPVIAITGVQCQNFLPPILEKLEKLGVKKIKVAFDMDMLTNPRVQSAFNKLVILFQGFNFKVEKLTWNENFKGLDDYLFDKFKKESK